MTRCLCLCLYYNTIQTAATEHQVLILFFQNQAAEQHFQAARNTSRVSQSAAASLVSLIMTWSHQDGLGLVKHTSLFNNYADWPNPEWLHYERFLVAGNSDIYFFQWQYRVVLQRWLRAICRRWFTNNSFPIRTFWTKSHAVYDRPQTVTIPIRSQHNEMSIRFSRIPVETVWFREDYYLTPDDEPLQISNGTQTTWGEWISWK